MTAHNFRDVTGQTFGYLTVLRHVENNKDGRARFRCKCIACGRKDYDVLGKHLMRGGTFRVDVGNTSGWNRSMLEHRRAIFGDVFVEQNAGPKAAQQPCQRGLTFEERAISLVLAIMLDEVEGIEGLRFAQPPPASPYPIGGATLFLETPFD